MLPIGLKDLIHIISVFYFSLISLFILLIVNYLISFFVFVKFICFFFEKKLILNK